MVNEATEEKKLSIRVVLKEPNGFYMSPIEQEFFANLTLRFDPKSAGQRDGRRDRAG